MYGTFLSQRESRHATVMTDPLVFLSLFDTEIIVNPASVGLRICLNVANFAVGVNLDALTCLINIVVFLDFVHRVTFQ
jgi:hypothetical protein